MLSAHGKIQLEPVARQGPASPATVPTLSSPRANHSDGALPAARGTGQGSHQELCVKFGPQTKQLRGTEKPLRMAQVLQVTQFLTASHRCLLRPVMTKSRPETTTPCLAVKTPGKNRVLNLTLAINALPCFNSQPSLFQKEECLQGRPD